MFCTESSMVKLDLKLPGKADSISETVAALVLGSGKEIKTIKIRPAGHKFTDEEKEGFKG